MKGAARTGGKNPLRKYQTDGVKRGIEILKTNRALLIADDTGLGKTPQSLFICEALVKPKENVLIICPSFLKPKWGDEIIKWLPKKNFNILLYSYNDITKKEIYQYLKKHKYTIIVIDEGHYLKNFDAERTQAFFGPAARPELGIFQNCRKLISLTATPIPNRIGEIFPFLSRCGLTQKTYEIFVKFWAGFWRETPYGLSHKGIKNPEKFFRQLEPIMIRRFKQNVLKDLPPGVRDIIKIPASAELYRDEMKLLEQALTAAGYSLGQVEMLIADGELLNAVLSHSPSFQEYTEFKKRQGLFKCEWVLKYLQEIVLPEKKKFILFTYHRETALYYSERLKKFSPIYIDGTIEAAERWETLKAANKKENCILICTMKSVTEGVDLIGFDRAYFAEIDWAPYVLEQCEGRLLRWGQKNPVFWYYFLFDRGMEAYIKKVIDEKFKTINSIIGRKNNG